LEGVAKLQNLYFDVFVRFFHTVARHVEFVFSWKNLRDVETVPMDVGLTDVGVSTVQVSTPGKSVWGNHSSVFLPVIFYRHRE
jgi:hypothetical protein